ncbi:MAG: YbjN domain-containing protein [Brevundimonas sp.]|uniref:YbjN domain-containing protein n=1 Tax=Brevundimonas sp. TaxID=1871086 RepID=UPI003001E499
MFRRLSALAPLIAAPALLMAVPALAAGDPGAAPVTGPVAAPTQEAVSGLTPAEVRAWLTEKGATVEEPQTIQGQTLLRVNDGSATWLIFFYGCDATGRCQDIQFAASVVADGLSLDRINAWNREQRFVKAYLQPNQSASTAVLQFDVLLSAGLGVEQLNDPTVVWLELLAGFIESVFAPTNQTAPPPPVTLPIR